MSTARPLTVSSCLALLTLMKPTYACVKISTLCRRRRLRCIALGLLIVQCNCRRGWLTVGNWLKAIFILILQVWCTITESRRRILFFFKTLSLLQCVQRSVKTEIEFQNFHLPRRITFISNSHCHH